MKFGFLNNSKQRNSFLLKGTGAIALALSALVLPACDYGVEEEALEEEGIYEEGGVYDEEGIGGEGLEEEGVLGEEEGIYEEEGVLGEEEEGIYGDE